MDEVVVGLFTIVALSPSSSRVDTVSLYIHVLHLRARACVSGAVLLEFCTRGGSCPVATEHAHTAHGGSYRRARRLTAAHVGERH
jgi:hypothetical protein